MSDWHLVDEEITCNAKDSKERDYDGLDDKGGEVLQGLLIRLLHSLQSGQINPGAGTCRNAANKFNIGAKLLLFKFFSLSCSMLSRYSQHIREPQDVTFENFSLRFLLRNPTAKF